MVAKARRKVCCPWRTVFWPGGWEEIEAQRSEGERDMQLKEVWGYQANVEAEA